MTSKHIQADDNDVMDLVDKNDQVIGSITQSEARGLLETKAGFIRGAVAFVRNDEDKIWTPRRAANKRIAPNGLDFSVAEHVQAGKSYEEGVIRGFNHSLAVQIRQQAVHVPDHQHICDKSYK